MTLLRLQTLTFDVCVVPSGVFQTQDDLRCSIIGVFEASMASHHHQRVVDCCIST